jgi:hypothetical protein
VVIVKKGGALTWVSKMQSAVAASTTCDAGCASETEAVKQAVWVRQPLGELEGRVHSMTVYCNN